MALTQDNAPIYEALERMRRMRVVPFDVPGHKRGRGNQELTDFLGEACMSVDVNSMKPLDNLCHPVSVIRDAEDLAAQAFGADSAFFMVGGTTSAVQSMILYACKNGDKIIMPRNVHRSAINALILCGAVPVYVNPDVNNTLGIALGMSVSQVEQAILENPDAKAVMVNNPTYYGICSDIKNTAEECHAKNIPLLVDEAHGAHFIASNLFPQTAVKYADAVCQSAHKTLNAMNGSSYLHINGDLIDRKRLEKSLYMFQSSSPSYVIASSADIARDELTDGAMWEKTYDMCKSFKEKITDTGIKVLKNDDMTRLVLNFSNLDNFLPVIISFLALSIA